MNSPRFFHRLSRQTLLVFLLLAAVLAACNGATPAPAASAVTPTDASQSTQPPALPAASPVAPTAAPDPERVILLAAPGAEADAASVVLAELAEPQGWTVETRAELAAGDVTPGVKVVVALTPPQNLGQLLSAGPGAQFVLVSSADVPDQAANLTVIRASREAELFLAGYLGMLVSDDWRSAGLVSADNPGWMEAFLNGGRYLCGRCLPLYPPAISFPLAAAQPGGSGVDAWRVAADELNANVINVMYVAPEASSPDLLAYLVSKDMRLVGGTAPSPDVAANWVATVHADALASLRALWPDLVAGKGGQTVTARVEVSNIQESLLSPGRQRLVDEVRTALETGLLEPGAQQQE